MSDAYGRSPALDTLEPAQRLRAWITRLAELKNSGEWPIPQGVTLYRTSTGQWLRLPDPMEEISFDWDSWLQDDIKSGLARTRDRILAQFTDRASEL